MASVSEQEIARLIIDNDLFAKVKEAGKLNYGKPDEVIYRVFANVNTWCGPQIKNAWNTAERRSLILDGIQRELRFLTL